MRYDKTFPISKRWESTLENISLCAYTNDSTRDGA